MYSCMFVCICVCMCEKKRDCRKSVKDRFFS